ncbi:MAG: hypothetical protein DDT19_01516 [Syntrophomonadaceae bacterium]|nr:hypothetical protein [Bacillota bacterium]
MFEAVLVLKTGGTEISVARTSSRGAVDAVKAAVVLRLIADASRYKQIDTGLYHVAMSELKRFQTFLEMSEGEEPDEEPAYCH